MELETTRYEIGLAIDSRHLVFKSYIAKYIFAIIRYMGAPSTDDHLQFDMFCYSICCALALIVRDCLQDASSAIYHTKI